MTKRYRSIAAATPQDLNLDIARAAETALARATELLAQVGFDSEYREAAEILIRVQGYIAEAEEES